MSENVFQELKIRSQLDPVVRRKMAAYPLQFLAHFDLISLANHQDWGHKAPTLDEMHQAVSCIQDSLRNNQPIVVHCERGLGRTGTIIAGYLTTCRLHAQEAIDYIRRLRPGSIETEEQEALIYEYERMSL